MTQEPAPLKASAVNLVRREKIIGPLNMAGHGIEIAPYFNPILLKSEFNVVYTDYISTEEIRAKAALNPGSVGAFIPEVDYVWTPGKPLRECISRDVSFDYAVASHVVEHVPNMIGWLNDILAVLKTGGVLALCVPDKEKSVDYYRSETTIAQLVGSWVEQRANPDPSQVFDYLSQTFYDVGVRPGPFELGVPFEEVERPYTDRQSLEYAMRSHADNSYIDVHATAWTAQGFCKTIRRLAAMGLLNVSVSEPYIPEAGGWAEFIVHLTKLGDMDLKPIASFQDRQIEQLTADRDHARDAFAQCAAIVQEVQGDLAATRSVLDATRQELADLRARSPWEMISEGMRRLLSGASAAGK